MADTTTELGRSKCVYPDLGYSGGAPLQALYETFIAKLSDNANARFHLGIDISDGGTVTFEHNFKCAFGELRTILYGYNETSGELTRLVSGGVPDLDDFTVIAAPGNPTTEIRVTNDTGSEQDFALVVIHGRGAENLDDLDDVDTSGKEDGQALVYDLASLKFKTGPSGDSSFKFQSIVGTNLTIKQGHKILTDGREVKLSADLVYDLSGITTNGDYYGYIDLNKLPVQSTLVSGREVYIVTSDMLVFNEDVNEDIVKDRYAYLGTIQRVAGVWANPQTVAQSQHQMGLGSDASLVYDKVKSAVGDVGDSAQFKAGHLLGASSFPEGSSPSFYPLSANGNDSGNSNNLTPNNSPTFGSNGIDGNTSAVALNGSNQYLNSISDYFNMGDNDHSFGVWAKASNWNSNYGTIVGNWKTPNLMFTVSAAGVGTTRIQVSFDGTTEGAASVIADNSGWVGWKLLIFVYDATNNVYKFYVDGAHVHDFPVSGTLFTPASGNGDLVLGANSGGSAPFNGSLDEFFFLQSTLSDNEIKKLYASKIAHGAGLDPSTQRWEATGTASGIDRDLVGFIIDKKSDELFFDFSDQLATTEIAMKLVNSGVTGRSKPTKARTLVLTASQIDALMPLTHRLGSVPGMSLKVSDGTDFELHGAGSFFKVDETQIKSTGTTLASVYGGSTVCILEYWAGVPSTFVPNKYWDTRLESSGPIALLSGDELLADTSGGGFPATLPASPSRGDRVRYSLAGSNTLTLDRNGKKIGGLAEDLTTSTDGDSGELVYDGVDNWRIF